MALRYVLLGLLVDRADHGYSLKRRLSPGLTPERLINDGILYPVLKRMQQEGLLSSHTETHGGRERRLFSATAEGRHVFLAWLRSDADEGYEPNYDLYVAQPLVKLLFSEQLRAAEITEKLLRHTNAVSERLATLDRLRSMMNPDDRETLNALWLDLEIAQQKQRLDGLQRLLGQTHLSGAETLVSGDS